MALLSVGEALHRITSGIDVTGTEPVDLFAAAGRVLAEPVVARRTQPPFDVSAMDGFAVRAGDVPVVPTTLRLIGQSAAGHGFDGAVSPGEAVRIFTGAPVPDGADAIVIQENTSFDANSVTIIDGGPDAGFIRPLGYDFSEGQKLITEGRRLTSRDITLAAAAGHARLVVRRRPRIAILATGDELVLPGEPIGPDQIVCSNPFGIAAIVEAAGGDPEFLGIAPDESRHLREMCERALGRDVLVTVGGASVGDHDLVGPVLAEMGLDLAFWKITMRPGKPLMSGRLGALHVLGLPGNPVSSMICARIFLVPLIKALLGLPATGEDTYSAISTAPLAANGARQHYMRATLVLDDQGVRQVTPVASQDSSLLAHLAAADCLIVRPVDDPAKLPGDAITILPLDF